MSSALASQEEPPQLSIRSLTNLTTTQLRHSTDDDSENAIPGMTTDNDADLRVGGETPGSDDVVDIPDKPDITLFCSTCSCFVDLSVLATHRYYHRALEIMRYSGVNRPDSVHCLLKRRRAILRKMKKKTSADEPLNQLELQKINEAYEFLKADVEDTFQAYRDVSENTVIDVRGVALNCSALCVLAVGFASDDNARWKSQMEDTRVFQDCFGSDPNKCFFGIYDGHHGRFAAEIAANELHHALLIEMEKFDPKTKCTCTFNMADSYDISHYDIHSRPNTATTIRGEIHDVSSNIIHQIIASCEDIVNDLQKEDQPDQLAIKKNQRSMDDPFAMKMADAFKKAHKHTDVILSWGRDEMSRVRWSGTSTLGCVVLNKMQHQTGEQEKTGIAGEEEEEAKSTVELEELGVIHLANAGNTHAVLVRGNQAYRISRDHTPNNKREKNRIIKEGGTVSMSQKELRVNGVLTATRGLGNHGDPLLKKCVINEPYTTAVKIDQYAQMMIMASQGVWDVFTPEEAASLSIQMLPSNHVPPPSRISSCINRLLVTPRVLTTPSEVHSMDTDYLAANRKEAARVGELQGPRSKLHSEMNDPAPVVLPNELDRLENASMADNYSGDESGNEADVDTCYTDNMSRLLGGLPTREEIQREYARYIAERLVQAALLAGARDNITAAVILFPGSGL